MSVHPYRERFKPQIQQEGCVGGWVCPHIPHHLYPCFCDISSVLKTFRIDDAMIGLIRFSEFGEIAVFPVKITAVDNDPAHLHCMAIHVFRSGMDHDIRSKLKRSAKVWRRERVVHNQRHVVFVRNRCPFFDIQNR